MFTDKPHIILYMFGAAGLPSVNSLALATCVLKTSKLKNKITSSVAIHAR